ncbi:MAG TPA: hypothetical protein VGR48_08910 [Terriglobales bacterium]|nr:hypothetical protein [Terriglobales bacterium]
MKQLQITVLALVVMLCGAPAFAQHGHGMGPGGMNPAMGEGGSHRMDPHTSSSSIHGMNMDQLLTKNTALAGKIQSLTHMPAQQACSGFKNLGQCVAAAHVSHNLGINFACMKADMTGVAAPTSAKCPVTPNASTSTKGMSLGKAIQTLQPTANSKLETKKANKQADQDIKDSSNS